VQLLVGRVIAEGRGRRLDVLEHRAGERGGTGEPRLTLGRRGLVEQGLEQLADDAERKPALQLASTRPEDAKPLCARERVGGPQQARLAESAGRFQDEHGAGAALYALQCVSESVLLRIPLQ
jgi:hypothetical protein